MDLFKSLQIKAFSTHRSGFDPLALEVFRFQAKENPVYASYLRYLGVKSNAIDSIDKIPFLPIDFFKNHQVITGGWAPAVVFESSGTTGQVTSKHYLPSKDFYLENCYRIFHSFYGDPNDYVWLALLPSYLERSNSSLVAMVDSFMKRGKGDGAGFYLNDFGALCRQLKVLKKEGKPTILLGVTFALLDLAEMVGFTFPELIIIETGGMKGRREELVRGEVHQLLKNAFGVPAVHSEYGMTELCSQAYAKKKGVFQPGSTLKVLTRDINDPFYVSNGLRSGGLNIIDLANVHSCAFIETKDLGKVAADGSFEVLGRMDNSDIRGCNLMLA